MLLNILLALLIIVGVGLTGLVLLQRSEGGALGMGGGGSGQLVSARGAANFLTRATWWLGAAFFILSLAITITLGRSAGSGSITDDLNLKVDPAKMAADRAAFEQREKARIDAENAAKGLPGGFTAPAPTVGAQPFVPAAPAGVPTVPAPAAPAPATK